MKIDFLLKMEIFQPAMLIYKEGMKSSLNKGYIMLYEFQNILHLYVLNPWFLNFSHWGGFTSLVIIFRLISWWTDEIQLMFF